MPGDRSHLCGGVSPAFGGCRWIRLWVFPLIEPLHLIREGVRQFVGAEVVVEFNVQTGRGPAHECGQRGVRSGCRTLCISASKYRMM